MYKKIYRKGFYVEFYQDLHTSWGGGETFCESSKNGGLWGIHSSMTSDDDVNSKQTGHVGGAHKHI
jgi:hypothetical protein